MEFLKQFGITWDWANSMKATQRINDPVLAQYYAAAMRRLQQEGMVSLNFPKQRRGAKVRFI